MLTQRLCVVFSNFLKQAWPWPWFLKKVTKLCPYSILGLPIIQSTSLGSLLACFKAIYYFRVIFPVWVRSENELWGFIAWGWLRFIETNTLSSVGHRPSFYAYKVHWDNLFYVRPKFGINILFKMSICEWAQCARKKQCQYIINIKYGTSRWFLSKLNSVYMRHNSQCFVNFKR